MPAKLHMTVPEKFRRKSEIPRVLVLHHADLPHEDIEIVHGVRVTKPMRTILDLLRDEEVSLHILRQALQEGLRRHSQKRNHGCEAATSWRKARAHFS
jgi:hypothetical protein